MPEKFSAFVARRIGGAVDCSVQSVDFDCLGDSGVLVKVSHSGINYKDALACQPNGNVAKTSPLVPGIDLTGVIVEDPTGTWVPGSPVIAQGHDLGTARHGGFAEYARVPEEWLFSRPEKLTAEESMTLGTAGFTAMLSILALEAHGLDPGQGPVLVTGATGGVGSSAVALLAARGYEVVASTGKSALSDWLSTLGASEVVPRVESTAKPLARERWAGAVDCVGGIALAQVLSEMQYGSAVAASGLTGGTSLPTTVFPFILRGVSLLGVDSAYCSMPSRRQAWEAMAQDLTRPKLELLLSRVVSLDDVSTTIRDMLDGRTIGRTVLDLSKAEQGKREQ